MKKYIIFVLVLLICFSFQSILSLQTTSADEPVGTIYGTTYQIRGWQTFPVAFVLIQAGPYSTLSNLNGEYSLELPIQTYQVMASKPGFTSQTFTADLTEQNPCQIHFQLQFKYTMSFTEAQQYYPKQVLNQNMYSFYELLQFDNFC